MGEMKPRTYCVEALAVLCDGRHGRLAIAFSLALAKLDLGALNDLMYDVANLDLETVDDLELEVRMLVRERFQQ